jgi:hypothetical protein
MNKTRDELIQMTDEEIMCWVWDVPVGSTHFESPTDPIKLKEFQNRWDKRFGLTLTRLGIDLEPSISGELKLEYNE